MVAVYREITVITNIITRLMARPDCCMAQGTAKSEVPIIVFQIDNLKQQHYI